MKSLTVFFYLFVIVSFTSRGQIDIAFDEVEKGAFFEVSLNPELGSKNNKIKKWKGDIKVFIKNPEQKTLVEEFEKVRDEINSLSTSISLERVCEEAQANFLIFFSDREEYGNYDNNLKQNLENNWGLFWLYWNSKNEIYKGSMYVDIVRTKDVACQKHLLREELTQALGLMNDTYKLESSIFHQQWSCETSYSKIDKDIIKLFLSSYIKPGMNRAQIVSSLNWE